MRRLLVLAAFLLLPHAAPAAAATGPCLPERPDGPRCHQWTGKVVFVADGDTIDVDLDGDGSRAARHIRLTGINAAELTRYSRTPSRRRGACHGVEAAARLEGLLRAGGWRVRLAAQDPSSRSGRRLRRQVSVRRGGRWVDVGRVLVAEGLALWLPGHPEVAWNDDYRTLSRQALARHAGLFDPAACGPVPAPGAELELTVNWDADGADAANVNGEWMRVRNAGGAPVDLGGWWVRDAALRSFVFPRGTTVGPGSAVTVFVGRGQGGGDRLFWGLSEPAFENAGDGAYLFDRRGNVRAAVVYP